MDPSGLAPRADFVLALFARATFTVQIVMVLLIVASVWSWAIIIQKHIAFRLTKRASSAFDAAFCRGAAGRAVRNPWARNSPALPNGCLQPEWRNGAGRTARTGR